LHELSHQEKAARVEASSSKERKKPSLTADATPFDLVRVIKARAAADEGMTKLIPNNGQITLINTYAVKPERAEELIEFPSRATQETLPYIPGFISANLHLSFDRSKIVNYAQWIDAEATAVARQDPKVAELMRGSSKMRTALARCLATCAARSLQRRSSTSESVIRERINSRW
jgi:hypothetical protein